VANSFHRATNTSARGREELARRFRTHSEARKVALSLAEGSLSKLY
jgi:hypothetical protein